MDPGEDSALPRAQSRKDRGPAAPVSCGHSTAGNVAAPQHPSSRALKRSSCWYQCLTLLKQTGEPKSEHEHSALKSRSPGWGTAVCMTYSTTAGAAEFWVPGALACSSWPGASRRVLLFPRAQERPCALAGPRWQPRCSAREWCVPVPDALSQREVAVLCEESINI